MHQCIYQRVSKRKQELGKTDVPVLQKWSNITFALLYDAISFINNQASYSKVMDELECISKDQSQCSQDYLTLFAWQVGRKP